MHMHVVLNQLCKIIEQVRSHDFAMTIPPPKVKHVIVINHGEIEKLVILRSMILPTSVG